MIQSQQKQRFSLLHSVQCGYGPSQDPEQWGLGFYHWGHNGRCMVKCKEQYLCLCAMVLDEVQGLYLYTSEGTVVAVNITTAEWQQSFYVFQTVQCDIHM